MGFEVPGDRSGERLRAARRRRSILRSYLAAVETGVDWSEPRYRRLEARFVGIAADHARARGISAEAWLQFGVPRRVVEAAGLAPRNQLEQDA